MEYWIRYECVLKAILENMHLDSRWLHWDIHIPDTTLNADLLGHENHCTIVYTWASLSVNYYILDHFILSFDIHEDEI